VNQYVETTWTVEDCLILIKELVLELRLHCKKPIHDTQLEWAEACLRHIDGSGRDAR
jgi:hypothetical protein